jgi:hypothetical protein
MGRQCAGGGTQVAVQQVRHRVQGLSPEQWWICTMNQQSSQTVVNGA